LEAATVGQVFVVGPSDRLRRVLGDLGERITIVEQAGKMLTNTWQAIYAAEARYRECHGRDDPLRPLLFISSDLPLVSAPAIDDFVTRCASVDSREPIPGSMFAGVAEEASLARYYPDGRGPGIRRPYVHLAECKVRLANIYVGRPRTLAHQQFLQTGFDHRKAEQWKNVMALAWNFLGQAGGWQAAWITLRLQATLLAAREPPGDPGASAGGLYRRLRRGNTTRRILQACSAVLGGTVRMVITPWGGLSLDADNDDDFQVLSRRYEEWCRIGPVASPAASGAD
jgi:hypothetical protein